MRILKFRYLIILILFVLSSCGGSRNYKNKKLEDDWIAQEAKLFDVPVLIDALPEKSHSVDQLASISSVIYTVPNSLHEALDFYEQEMERYGWNLWTSFISNEVLLLFEKPSKICSISIRPCKKKIRVVIYVKAKD